MGRLPRTHTPLVRMPCKTSQVLAILASLLPAALIPAQITASHQDEVHGFRLKVPKRYKRLPVEKDRHCVLLHWVCKQGYAVKGVRGMFSEWATRTVLSGGGWLIVVF